MQSILNLALFASHLISTELCNQLDLSDKPKTLSYPYVKFSDQWIAFPGLGIGYRHHGTYEFDVDIAAYTYWHSGWTVYGKTHYLFFPNEKDYTYFPDKEGRFYVGVGVGMMGGNLNINNPFAFFGYSPMPAIEIKPTAEVVIGHEWPSIRGIPCFYQIEAGFSYGEIFVYPVISGGLGF